MSLRPTPGQILDALREAVTIIEPGEILAVRVAPPVSDQEWDEMRQRAEQVSADHGVKVLLLAGEEFARLKRGDQS